MVTKEQYEAMSQKDKDILLHEVNEHRHMAFILADKTYAAVCAVCEGVEVFYSHSDYLPQEAKWPWKVATMEKTVVQLREMRERIEATLRMVE